MYFQSAYNYITLRIDDVLCCEIEQ